jgi:hypothetical protein
MPASCSPAKGCSPSSKGTRVKFSAGKRTVIDGPFLELRELVAAANGTPSLSTSVVLNRRALVSSLISRASGFAVANGSVPSIRIVISRPERRSRIGIDRIWISSSVALLGNGVTATSRSAASRRAEMDVDPILERRSSSAERRCQGRREILSDRTVKRFFWSIEQPEVDRVAHLAVADVAGVQPIAAIVDRPHLCRDLGIA